MSHLEVFLMLWVCLRRCFINTNDNKPAQVYVSYYSSFSGVPSLEQFGRAYTNLQSGETNKQAPKYFTELSS